MIDVEKFILNLPEVILHYRIVKTVPLSRHALHDATLL